MDLVSNWKLTLEGPGLAPYVVLVWDQRISSELTLPWTQTTETQRKLRRGSIENFARENIARGLTIGAYKSHNSDAAGRNWMAALQVSLSTYSGRNDLLLKLEILDGDTYYIDNVVLAEAPTVMVPAGEARTLTTWKFLTGDWTLDDAPAGPGPEGLDQAILNLSRGSSLKNAAGNPAGLLEKLATWTNTGTGDDAVQATDANRPTVLVGPGLYLSGASGNYWGWNHESALHPGTTFAIRWDGILSTFTPAARMTLMSKWQDGGNQRSWAVYLEPSGCVTLAISTDGTAGTVTEFTSAIPLGLPAGSFAGIGVRKVGTQLVFSVFPALEWTDEIFFSPAQTISNLDPFNSTVPVITGGDALGSANILSGLVHRIQYFGATGGWGTNSTLALVDFTGQAPIVSPSAGITAGSAAGADKFVQPPATGLIRFDGSNDSLSLGTPLPLNGVDGVTLAIYGDISVTSGTRDLLFIGSNDADPRLLLRVNAGTLELHVRRLDGEAAALISAPLTNYNQRISASVDYVAGTATLYLWAAPVASGVLTSGGGPCSATDSSETRIMCGQGGANPAAGDIYHVYVAEGATNVFEHAALWEAILAS